MSAAETHPHLLDPYHGDLARCRWCKEIAPEGSALWGQSCPRSSGPRRFRKKPVTIRAIQWTGDNLREVIAFTGRHPSAEGWSWEEFEGVVAKDGLKVFTVEGPLKASVGDWIIRGVQGEHYPCKPDIFEATYESVGR